jgi:hypothetical protein
MRTWKWMFTAALLASVSATAQQPAESQPSTQPAAAVATQTAPTVPASQPAATDAQSAQSTAPAPTPSALPQPTTMDQVVDRFIEREH